MNFEKLSDIIKYYQTYHLTKYKYTYRLALLAPFDDYPLSTLRRADVKKWALQRQQQVSNATVNKEIAFCRAAINRASTDFEVTLNNPFTNVKYIESDTIPNYLTYQEYERLLSASLEFDNTDLHDFIILLVMTGCRQSEVLTLKWANVHLDKHQFIVRNTLSKSRRTMYKYLNDSAYQVLKTALPINKAIMFLPIPKRAKISNHSTRVGNSVKSVLALTAVCMIYATLTQAGLFKKAYQFIQSKSY